MATAYSSNLALALPVTGELSGTWGTTVNTQITNMLDEALGYQAVSVTLLGPNTLTIPDGTTGVARSIYIQLNGTGGGTVTVPTAKTKMYFVFNNTAAAITFKVTGQTGVSIPAAAKMALFSNGTDIFDAENYFSALTLGAALPVASGGTGITSFGTGVATWLGTPSSANLAAAVTDETGSGALVFGTSPTLVTPALGSPSSVGTMPAFTLGGTVSGGGNNINNVIIGATTPLAGAFTTLSATGTSTLAAINASGNVTSTGTVGIANNSGYLMKDSAGNYRTMSILNGSNIMSFGDTDNFGAAEVRLIAGTGNPLKLYGGNTLVATLTSTELAVTGTLSATGVIGASGGIQLGGQTLSWNEVSVRSWTMTTATTSGSLSINSGDAGGSLKVNVPLAVTGTLSATGTLSGGTSGTAYSFSGSAPATSLTLDSSGSLAIGPDSGKTTASLLWTANTGGRLYVGKESSAGGTIINGTSAYAAVIATNSAHPLQFGTNNQTNITLDTSGNLGIGDSSPPAPGGADARVISLQATKYPQFIYKATSAAAGSTVWRTIARDVLNFQIQTLNDATTIEQTAYEIVRDTGSTSINYQRWYTGSGEKMRLDNSGNLLVGQTSVGSGGTLAVNGSISIGATTNGSQSSMAKDGTQLTSSVSTSATTIYTDISAGMSSASAGYFIIYGHNNAGAGFMDVVIAKPSGTPVVVSSSTVQGVPSVRTYSVSSSALQLAMVSGTFSINLKATVIGYPF